jgi:hypothetical protein
MTSLVGEKAGNFGEMNVDGDRSSLHNADNNG